MDASFLGQEQCENVKEVVSKFGVAVVCDEKDEEKEHKKNFFEENSNEQDEEKEEV